MTTSSFQHLDRPEGTGPSVGQDGTPMPDDDVRFWELVDLIEGMLTQN